MKRAWLISFAVCAASLPVTAQRGPAAKNQSRSNATRPQYDHLGTLTYTVTPSVARDSDSATYVSVDGSTCTVIHDGVSNSVSCHKDTARDFNRWEDLRFDLDDGAEILAPSIDCANAKPASEADAIRHPCSATGVGKNDNALYLFAIAHLSDPPAEQGEFGERTWKWQIHYRLYTTPRDHKQFIAVATEAGEIFYAVYRPEPEAPSKSSAAIP